MTTIHCPICNNIVKYDYYTEPFGIVEEQIACPHCGYYYQFAYGNYIECVKGKVFMWDYTIPYIHPIFKRIKRATFMAKRNWKKFKKSYLTIK